MRMTNSHFRDLDTPEFIRGTGVRKFRFAGEADATGNPPDGSRGIVQVRLGRQG